MIRLSRLTDYGIVLLSYMAARPDAVVTARGLSQESKLPLPTVSKILKLLCSSGLIESYRGVNGGYRLSRPPSSIHVVEIIDALDGPVAMTSCSVGDLSQCLIDQTCPVKNPWQKINSTVRSALSQLSLLEMSQSISLPSNGAVNE